MSPEGVAEILERTHHDLDAIIKNLKTISDAQKKHKDLQGFSRPRRAELLACKSVGPPVKTKISVVIGNGGFVNDKYFAVFYLLEPYLGRFYDSPEADEPRQEDVTPSGYRRKRSCGGSKAEALALRDEALSALEQKGALFNLPDPHYVRCYKEVDGRRVFVPEWDKDASDTLMAFHMLPRIKNFLPWFEPEDGVFYVPFVLSFEKSTHAYVKGLRSLGLQIDPVGKHAALRFKGPREESTSPDEFVRRILTPGLGDCLKNFNDMARQRLFVGDQRLYDLLMPEAQTLFDEHRTKKAGGPVKRRPRCFCPMLTPAEREAQKQKRQKAPKAFERVEVIMVPIGFLTHCKRAPGHSENCRLSHKNVSNPLTDWMLFLFCLTGEKSYLYNLAAANLLVCCETSPPCRFVPGQECFI